MRKNRLILFLVFLVLCGYSLLFLSCKDTAVDTSSLDDTDTSGTETTDEDDPIIEKPENVVCELDPTETFYHVSWNEVPGAEKYHVYRKAGVGSFTFLITVNAPTTFHDDYTFPPGETIQYAIQSEAGGVVSPMSVPSGVVSLYVQGLAASKLEYGDKVILTWDDHTEAESYIIYRYVSTIDPSPVTLGETEFSNFADDLSGSTPPDLDIPYFYKVMWKKDSIEYGSDCPHVLGVVGSSVDYGEINDHLSDLEDQGSSSIFNPLQPPILYSFGDGDGGVEADIDWYKYHGPVTTIYVKVTFPQESDFDPGTPAGGGDVNFRFYFDGQYKADEVLYKEHDTSEGWGRTFSFSDYGGATGDVDVYFQIFPVVESTRNVIGTYTVEISDEL